MPGARRVSVVIVGAGFGGIAAAIELGRHGFDDVTVLERADGLGGTWHYNCYPGCARYVPGVQSLRRRLIYYYAESLTMMIRNPEVRPEAEAVSDRELQARFAGTAWVRCDSWYRDAGGRIVANWPGYMREYAERVRVLDPSEFSLASPDGT